MWFSAIRLQIHELQFLSDDNCGLAVVDYDQLLRVHPLHLLRVAKYPLQPFASTLPAARFVRLLHLLTFQQLLQLLTASICRKRQFSNWQETAYFAIPLRCHSHWIENQGNFILAISSPLMIAASYATMRRATWPSFSPLRCFLSIQCSLQLSFGPVISFQVEILKISLLAFYSELTWGLTHFPKEGEFYFTLWMS